MKKVIFLFLVFINMIVYSQEINSKKILGTYFILGVEDSYRYVITEKMIIRFGFCDNCEDQLCIQTAPYTFINDTLKFSMRDDFFKRFDTINYCWVYINKGKGHFYDYNELEEYVRIKNIDKELEPFGLMIINTKRKKNRK